MKLLQTITTAAALFALALPAAAQLGPEHAEWADGPVRFLLTDAERKAWNAVDSDAEAEAFIDLFWARRDPDLTTPVNEFRQEFEARVRYADEHFGTEELRGSLSDRGRVLLLLGAPHRAEKRAPTETVVRMEQSGTGGAGTDEVRANAELWQYEPERLPESFKVKGSQLLYIFYEEKAESGSFTLDRSHRHAALGMKVLSRAPEALVVYPELVEAPVPVCVAGGQAATAAQLAWLDADAPFSDEAAALSSVGLGPDLFRPLWLHLQLPASAPRLDTLAGRVLGTDGSVQGTFAIAAQPLELEGAVAYQLSFPLEPGTWRVELAGAAGGTPQVVHALEATVEPVPDSGTWISPLWAAAVVKQEQAATAGAPYRFATLHLVPDARRTLPRATELPYFGFLVRPQVTPGIPPTLAGKMRISRDGERLGGPIDLALNAVQLNGDVWVYGGVLNMSAMPGPGGYAFSFTITDPATGAVAKDELSFELSE